MRVFDACAGVNARRNIGRVRLEAFSIYPGSRAAVSVYTSSDSQGKKVRMRGRVHHHHARRVGCRRGRCVLRALGRSSIRLDHLRDAPVVNLRLEVVLDHPAKAKDHMRSPVHNTCGFSAGFRRRDQGLPEGLRLPKV